MAKNYLENRKDKLIDLINYGLDNGFSKEVLLNYQNQLKGVLLDIEYVKTHRVILV